MGQIADLWIRLSAINAPYAKALAESTEQGEAFAEANKTQMEAVKASNEEGASSFGLLGKAAAGIAVGFVAASAVSVKWATEFQSAVTKLYTQAGITNSEITRAGYTTSSFQSKLLSLGNMAGYSGTQVADALYHPISAGLDLTSALAVVAASEKEARISGADLTDTTYTLSTVMKAFNYPASQAAQTMATLNAVVGNGDTTFQDLNESVKSWAPAANAFGVSLTSIGSALDYLTDRGDSATTAGTHLSMMMAMMVGQTKVASGYMTTLGLDQTQVKAATSAMSKAFEKSGITTTKLAGDLRKPDGIYVALLDLQNALKKSGLSANAAQDLLVRAFGGGKQFKTLDELMQNLPQLQGKFAQLTDQGGVERWQADWQKASATLKVQLDQIGASAKNAAIKFGTMLLPGITKTLATARTDVTGFARTIGPSLGQLWSGLSGKTPTIAPVTSGQRGPLSVQASIGTDLTAQTTAVERLGQALRSIGGNFLTFGKDAAAAGADVVRAVGPAAKALGGDLLKALSVVGSILATVVGPALKAFGDFLASHQGLVKIFAEVAIGGLITKLLILKGINAATGITRLATSILQFPMSQAGQIKTALDALKTAWSGKEAADGEKAIGGLKGAFSQLKGGIASALTSTKTFFTSAASGASSAFQTVRLRGLYAVDGIKGFFAGMPGKVSSAFETIRLKGMYAMDGLKSGVAAAASKFSSLASSGAQAAAKLGSSVWSGVISTMSSIGSSIAAAATATWGWVTSAAAATASAVREAAAFLIDKTATLAQAVADRAATIAQWLLDAAMDANPISLIIIAVTALVGAFILLWKKCAWFRDLWKDLWSGIKAVIADAVDIVKSLFSVIVSYIIGPIAKAISYLATHWEQIWSDIKDAAHAAWSWLDGNVFQPIQRIFEATIPNALHTMSSIWSSVWGTVRSVASSAWQWLDGSVLQPVARFLRSTIGGAVSAMTSAWSRGWGMIRSAVSSAWSYVRPIFNMITSAANTVGNAIGKVASVAGKIGSGVGKVGKFLGFDQGGFVPGSRGAPMLAVVHGGEYVVSNDMQSGRAPIDSRALTSTLNLAGSGSGGGARGLAVSGGGAGQNVTVINVIIQGNVTTTQGDFDQAVIRAVLQGAARNSNNGLAFNR